MYRAHCRGHYTRNSARPQPENFQIIFPTREGALLSPASTIRGVIWTDGQESETEGVRSFSARKFLPGTFNRSVYMEGFMNDESTFSKPKFSLDERFADDPLMQARLHQIADLRDRMLAEGVSLDEVEARTVEQIRLMGQELLRSIAQGKANQSTTQALKENPSLIRDRKKK